MRVHVKKELKEHGILGMMKFCACRSPISLNMCRLVRARGLETYSLEFLEKVTENGDYIKDSHEMSLFVEARNDKREEVRFAIVNDLIDRLVYNELDEDRNELAEELEREVKKLQ